ncbi:MAG: AmmeMemoRadiSam system protein A [Deltaproteobacteria bacterium]|nr:AmmeMemoRadiSam system protein A [Deltaproteobacteria bacterium]
MSAKIGVDLGLTAAEKEYLRQLAWAAIAKKLGRKVAEPRPPAAAPHLDEERGAFVTLKKGGALRGCIGHIQGDRPLAATIREMALAAAFQDPRFPPLRPEELDGLELEISVLTPLRLIDDPAEIQVGVHGIYLQCQGYAGLLLPQVATEYGWSREEFLNHTCMKAGLAPGCWRLSGARIYIFAADIF